MQEEFRVNPAMRYVTGGSIAFIVGLALVVQPWVSLLRPVGVLPMLAGLMLVVIMFKRARMFEHMRKNILGRFEEGVVMDGGLFYEGQIHFLGDAGVRLERCEIYQNELLIGYAFYAKKMREHVEAVFTLPEGDEAALLTAQAIVEKFGLIEAPKEEESMPETTQFLTSEIDVQ